MADDNFTSLGDASHGNRDAWAAWVTIIGLPLTAIGLILSAIALFVSIQSGQGESIALASQWSPSACLSLGWSGGPTARAESSVVTGVVTNVGREPVTILGAEEGPDAQKLQASFAWTALDGSSTDVVKDRGAYLQPGQAIAFSATTAGASFALPVFLKLSDGGVQELTNSASLDPSSPVLAAAFKRFGCK